jgi:hypothetical protein
MGGVMLTMELQHKTITYLKDLQAKLLDSRSPLKYQWLDDRIAKLG